MDCLDKVVDKKVRKPRTPKEPKEKKEPEEITSKMVSDQFDKVYIELKKLESYIFKPSIVEQPVLEAPLEPAPLEPAPLEPDVKKSRVSKKKPLIISVDGV